MKYFYHLEKNKNDDAEKSGISTTFQIQRVIKKIQHRFCRKNGNAVVLYSSAQGWFK